MFAMARSAAVAAPPGAAAASRSTGAASAQTLSGHVDMGGSGRGRHTQQQAQPVPLESGSNAPPLMVSRFSAPVPQPLLLAPPRSAQIFSGGVDMGRPADGPSWSKSINVNNKVGGVATAYMLAEDNPGISYFGGPPIADASLSSLKMDRPKSAPARVRSEFPETWIWTDLDTAAGDGKKVARVTVV
ncbi:hypothetical protein niasHT_027848 [Heterodera trifolii]|uniref:Uncharacterized protein n=1 Tax=Heterodera trifolii TaxID=157864 RepID=A0ABD2KP67_9BILA